MNTKYDDIPCYHLNEEYLTDALVLQRELARILQDMPQEVISGTHLHGWIGCATALWPTTSAQSCLTRCRSSRR
jgi:hypothetical protein